MTNEIAIKQDLGLSQVAKTFAASGYFTDARDAAQAVVKIMAGQELGIPAVAAMSGIHVVQGKPVLSSTTLAGLVKRSGRYNYKVRELTPTNCAIEFFEGSESIGVSEFSAADAKKAGTKNMDKYSRNMLFARAMSNGVKWYTPDLCAGPVYVPEDFDQGGSEPEPPTVRPTPPPKPPTNAEAEKAAQDFIDNPEGDEGAAEIEEAEVIEQVAQAFDGEVEDAPVPTPQEVKALEAKAGFAAKSHLANARARHLGDNPDAAAVSRYVDYLTAKIEAQDEAEGKEADAEASKAA